MSPLRLQHLTIRAKPAFPTPRRRFYTKTIKRRRFESCYGDQIWCPLFGLCVDSIPGVSANRGELSSISSRMRVNHQFTPCAYPKKPGPKYDMIVRSLHDNVEFAGAEISRVFESVHRPKWRDNIRKIGVFLRDMLVNINHHTGCNVRVLRQMQVVGMVAGGEFWEPFSLSVCRFRTNPHATGLTCQFLRMHSPAGYVSILHTEQMVTIPAGPSGAKELCRILKLMLQIKVPHPTPPLPFSLTDLSGLVGAHGEQ